MKRTSLLALPLCLLGGPSASAQEDVERLHAAFREPPPDSRPMMRWWWFGPAVTKEGIEHELRLMKEGGIGGFEVQPVYPLTVDDPARGIRNLPYLSDEFLEALRFTAEKAKELGLRFDLTLGSGWPFGGPQVPIDQAAAQLRIVKVKVTEGSRRVAVPDLSAGESLIAAFSSSDRKELTDVQGGVVRIPEGRPGPPEAWFFIAGRTGQMVKRAAVGAEGFVFDHYDRAALDNYLEKVGEPLLRAVGPNRPYAVFCDSLEVYANDWTGDLLPEFQKRRGYDLRPRLPALADEDHPDSMGVRRDWALTLSELVEERFIVPLREWARAHGTLLRMQDYGTPPATLSSNALVDLGEGEGVQWRALSPARWASSASHLFARPVTHSEAWTWLHSPVFRATPLDLKAEADVHFLQGINQLVGHGWPYTPEGVEYPGWRFYAAGVYDDKNPWWPVMPDLARYLQRLSFLMRQGRPVNDVALYLPADDAWTELPPGNVDLGKMLGQRIGPDVVGRVLDAGYGFDFMDDQALRQTARVEKGALACGDMRYRIIVLPDVGRLRSESLAKLSAFARAGGVVVATKRTPLIRPGLRPTPDENRSFRELVVALFEGPAARAHFVEDEAKLGEKLRSLVPPDVALSPPAPSIGFVHRRAGEAEIYFLANTGNTGQRVDATFRVEGLAPEWWNPLTGTAEPAAVARRDRRGVTVALDLEPYGSRVLVFTRHRRPGPALGAPATKPVVDLSAGWQVRFGDGAPVRMDALRSWTEDESTRYYSGLATYEKTFVLPGGVFGKGARVKLDFGETKPDTDSPEAGRWRQRAGADVLAPVREAAVITLNGKRAGSVWCPPYALDVTDLLRPGENALRIEVGNLALNHMAGHALPSYRLLNLRYGERFQMQDLDKVVALPSGLLGPVRLLTSAP